MSNKEYPSIDYLRQCLREEDGRLYWLVRPREHFAKERIWKMWNTKFALKEAGCLITTGGQDGRDKRWTIRLGSQNILGYVVVWALHHGEWVTGIDHKDRDPLNDRIENLRIGNQSQNTANSTLSSANTSGYKGVSWNKQKQKWDAYIKVNYRKKFLGRFDDIEEAHEVRAAAARKYFGEFACDGKSNDS